ncbi:NAD(P)H-hydrate dehydratase [soil metagenome]
MLSVVTASEMRALDRATIDEVGIPAFTLMETAGRAVAEVAREMAAGGSVAVVCGPGNNGGDGFVVARVLRAHHLAAAVYLAVPRTKITGDAATHLAILERAGGVVRMIDTATALGDLAGEITSAAVTVDALFGVGLARAIDGHHADVVAVINRAPLRLALDIPSGLDADTGKVLGVAVRADRTVTMAVHKVALVSSPGFAYCGRVTACDIGVPPGLLATQGVRAGFVEQRDVEGWLPRVRAIDHKGTRGHVLIVGGAPGMRGAGRVSAMAALRAGAGLVTLAAEGELAADDSIMTRSIPASGTDSITKLLEGKAAVVIGPGLGKNEHAARWLGDVLAAGVPAVVDADALNLIAGVTGALAKAHGPIVITPHPGEASRLLGIPTTEIEADRLAAARALAAQTRAVVVLKGARTIVCDGTLADDYCSINSTGGPALGTAGSGDVLAGVIGALLAQGLSAGDAARAAVFVHGRAGDVLALERGDRGVISSDLPLAIAGVVAKIPRLA